LTANRVAPEATRGSPTQVVMLLMSNDILREACRVVSELAIACASMERNQVLNLKLWCRQSIPIGTSHQPKYFFILG